MSLEDARKSLEKSFGDGIIKAFDDLVKPVEALPTGIVSLDKALCVGGFPRGRVIELFGYPGCGKSTLACHTVSETQRKNLHCLYVDFEHTFDPIYAKEIGVSFDSKLWTISQPDYLEQGCEVADKYLENVDDLGVIVIDSLAAMVPRVEVEGKCSTDLSVGLQSRLVAQFLKHVTSELYDRKVALIFINQMRHKIGSFISTDTTPGGEAPKHYASVRLDVRRIKSLKDAGTKGEVDLGDSSEIEPQMFGMRTSMNAVKSKVGIPYRKMEVNLIFGKGFDVIRDMYDYSEARNLFIKERGRISMKFNGEDGSEKVLVFKNLDEYRQVITEGNLRHALYNHLMGAVGD